MKYSFFVLMLLANIFAKAQPGTLDSTFNGTGINRVSFGPGTFAFGGSSAIQADGKIVMVGKLNAGEAIIARLNADGSIDSTFANDGFSTLSFTINNRYKAAGIQSDGKIVAVGDAYNGVITFPLIVRYNMDGSLDSTFSVDGIDTISNPLGSAFIYAVAIQADDKIIIAGEAENGSDNDLALLRFNANGGLDNNFNSVGVVLTDFGFDDGANSVKVLADGSIVAGGFAGGDFALAKYNTDGSLDTSFSGDGWLFSPIGTATSWIKGIAIQPDGKIVAAGNAKGVERDFAVVRFNADGSLDPTFNGTGVVQTDLFGDYENAYDVAIQYNGKIVAAGFADPTQQGYSQFTTIRYNGDGSIDSTFGVNGIVSPNIYDQIVSAVHVLADGKIILTGYSEDPATSTYTLTAVRLTGDCLGNINTGTTLSVATITADLAGATYQWIDCSNNDTISGETGQSFTATATGDYAVIVTIGSCTDTSACTNVLITGIDKSSTSAINVRPNPTTGMFSFNVNNDGVVNYTVTSLEGRIVSQERNVNEKLINVDLGNEASGIYILKVEGLNATNLFKIIKQ